ncbi:MAG: hypothetical protein FJY26_07040 [Betaproteobacteria bacterium]|nr:hypothetical protein [Betaproteobacteria bacterium]
MTSALATVELFLIAVAVNFTIAFLVWRFGRTDCWAPLALGCAAALLPQARDGWVGDRAPS